MEAHTCLPAAPDAGDDGDQGREELRGLAHGSAPNRCCTDSVVKNLPAMQETPIQFLGQEDLLEKG